MTTVLLTLLLTANGTPPKLASPPWNVVDIKPELAAFYAEQLAQALRAEGLTITTAGDIATILGAERQRELLGCSNENGCLVELANALGCDATLTVNLARLGDGFRGLAKVMSSADGTIRSSVKIEARSEAELADKIEAAAKVLALPLVGAKAAPAPAPFKPWWVPGAFGVAGVGVGIALLAGAGNTFAQLQMTTDSKVGRSLVTSGESLQAGGWIAVGVGSAAIIGSVLWLIFGSSEVVAPTVTLAPNQISFGLVGAF